MGILKPIQETSDHDWDQVLDTNLKGTFLTCREVIPHMESRGVGAIVNISSIAAFAYTTPHIPYAASKAGVIQLTKYLATHWGAYGVRVNTLSPGGVEGGQDSGFKKKFCDRVPLQRMAEKEDLKGPLVFLASDASSYVTGHNLKVEGGFTAW